MIPSCLLLSQVCWWLETHGRSTVNFSRVRLLLSIGIVWLFSVVSGSPFHIRTFIPPIHGRRHAVRRTQFPACYQATFSCPYLISAMIVLWYLLSYFLSINGEVSTSSFLSPTPRRAKADQHSHPAIVVQETLMWNQTKLPFSSQDPGNGKLMAIGYNGQNIAIATIYGLYVSSDYGNTFQWAKTPYDLQSEKGYSMLQPWTTVVSDSTGTSMYALTNEGILWSSNGDIFSQWLGFTIHAIHSTFTDIAIDGSGSYLYGIPIGANNDPTKCNVAQYLTSRGTQSKTASFPLSSCNKILTDNNGENILVSGLDLNHVAVSSDSGSTFTVYTLPYPVSITPQPTCLLVGLSYSVANNYVYIAAAKDTVEASTDGGQTFPMETIIDPSYHIVV